MKIRNSKEVLQFAALSTIAGCLVVASAVFLAYPPEQWAWELKISLSLTVFITMSICFVVGRKSIETYRLTMELKRLVERDRLTDVATRDYFYSRMSEDSEGFGVSLMVDIDHFKAVNDTHGHMVGDEVIRSVASVLRENVREEDIVCRFGGEEFVVSLQQHNEQQAYVVAERIREAVAALPLVVEDQPLRVTVSVGGSLRLCVREIDDAIKQADAALYRAQESGRNCTRFQALLPDAHYSDASSG